MCAAGSFVAAFRFMVLLSGRMVVMRQLLAGLLPDD
jgi:hypothetical protein